MKCSVWFLSPIAALLLCGYTPVMSRANPPVIMAQSSQWQQFTSTEGSYTVLMPTKTPLEKKSFLDTKVGRIELQDALADSEQELYGVSYGQYPGSQADPAKVLEEMQALVLTIIPGKLRKEQNLQLDGYSGKEIEIEGSEGATAIIRMYLVQQRLYLIAAATKEKKETFSQEAVKFFDSFRLMATKPTSGEFKPLVPPTQRIKSGILH